MTSPGIVIQHHRDIQAGFAKPSKLTAEFIRSLALGFDEYYSEKVADAVFAPYHPAKSLDDAVSFVQEVAQELFNAKSYLVTEDMVDAVTALYRQQPQGWKHLEVREMPATSGFVWLEKPFYAATSKFHDGQTVIKPCRAMSWYAVKVRADKKKHYRPGVRICFWHHNNDHTQEFESLNDEEKTMWKMVSESTGGMTLRHTCLILFGVDFPGFDDQEGDSVVSWMQTLWMFLNMEIVSQNPARIDRATRRRLGDSPFAKKSVNVVMLRRTSHGISDRDSASEGYHRHVDWSVQWLVRGHWRHLEGYEGSQHNGIPSSEANYPLCAVCGKKLTWVKPFIKGPDGKPLKVTEQLFKLAR